VDNYLHEAALADDPPSGAFYDPEGDGTRLESLGAHEHWNNDQDKQYSRNLGTGEGIELLSISGVSGGFRRGDANADATFDVSDAIATLLYLFTGERELSCLSSADADDTGTVDITDAILVLQYLFLGGDPLPPPFASCGSDPTPDDLDCESFPPCSGPTILPLVSAEDPARILIPADAGLGLTWTQVDFDDGAWTNGEAAVGYDDNADYRSHFTTDVASTMQDINTSAYIRIPFAVSDIPSLEGLTLWVKYDDGFIAYLNGVRVADRNAPATPSWDSTATGQHSDSQAVAFESIDISGSADLIAPGDNVLAIHGLNSDLGSSDFLIAAELDGRVR
jgi:hypothetical protein